MQSQAFKAKLISRKGRLGISNLIGILLAIVITLAIAGGVAAYTFGLVGSSSSNLSAMIITSSATYIASSGTTTVTLALKNTGTVAVASATVAADGTTLTTQPTWSPAFTSSAPLAAGQTASIIFSSPSAWGQGTYHTLSVTVTGMSGSTYITTQSVTVH